MTRPVSVRALLSAALVAALVVLCIVTVLFFARGGRWMVVESPSMGTALPVGTLVLTNPVSVSQLRVGDVISFIPQGVNPQMHTHRVVAMSRSAVTTRGDLNGADDPGKVTQSRLAGRVFADALGVGWVLRALPLLGIGTAVILLASARLPRARWRLQVRLVAFPCLAAIASLIYRPFVGIATVSSHAQGSGLLLRVVSTGVLPSRVEATHGPHADLASGQTATLFLHASNASGRVPIVAYPHMSWPWWVGVLLVCSIPLVCALVAKAGRVERRTAS